MSDAAADRVVDVAVVVVTYNSSDVLPGLIETLPVGLAELSWQLVVVDNASHDGSAALASGLLPACTVVETGHNAGYAGGLNSGVAAAPPHRAVLVLNPDVRLEPGCVATLVGALERPGVGVAVPRLADGVGELHFSLRREPTVLRAFGDAVLGARRAARWSALGELVTDPAAYADGHATDWAEGSTQLISAACWQACGPWDESFFLYSEETEFGLRARDHGFATWFEPRAHATHLQGDSTTSPQLWALLVTNRVRLHWRLHGPMAGLGFWLAAVLREATRAALGHDISKAALAALLDLRRWQADPGV